MELALGDRAVAEEARGDPVTALHLVRQRETDRQRQPAADDRVAAVEAGGGVEQVHRPARPRLQPSCLPYISAMIALRGHAAGQRVPVLAVGGDHGVLGRAARS